LGAAAAAGAAPACRVPKARRVLVRISRARRHPERRRAAARVQASAEASTGTAPRRTPLARACDAAHAAAQGDASIKRAHVTRLTLTRLFAEHAAGADAPRTSQYVEQGSRTLRRRVKRGQSGQH
jgi:hypothetical protein